MPFSPEKRQFVAERIALKHDYLSTNKIMHWIDVFEIQSYGCPVPI